MSCISLAEEQRSHFRLPQHLHSAGRALAGAAVEASRRGAATLVEQLRRRPGRERRFSHGLAAFNDRALRDIGVRRDQGFILAERLAAHPNVDYRVGAPE